MSPGLSQTGSGLIPMPTPGGVPVDDVAGQERHVAAAIRHDLAHTKDHRAGVARLSPNAVHVEPHVEPLRIGHLILRHEPGADRAEGVAPLTLIPLAALELESPFGDVVDHAIARDMVECFLFGDVSSRGPDHNSELHLPVEFGRVARLHRVVVWPADGARSFQKDDRLARDSHASFGGMVRVIQADADEFRDARIGNPKPGRSLHSGGRPDPSAPIWRGHQARVRPGRCPGTPMKGRIGRRRRRPGRAVRPPAHHSDTVSSLISRLMRLEGVGGGLFVPDPAGVGGAASPRDRQHGHQERLPTVIALDGGCSDRPDRTG